MKEQFNTALGNLIEKLKGWFNAIIENIPNFLLAILVMIASYYAAKHISKFVARLVSKKVQQDSVKNAIARVSSVIIVSKCHHKLLIHFSADNTSVII